MKIIDLYEKFHKKTSPLKKQIGKKNFTYRLILDALNQYLPIEGKVLDVGCGAGPLSFYVTQKSSQVNGIDISSKAVHACKSTAKKLGLQKRIKFKKSTFLNFTDRNFDLILFSEVLEHLEAELLALKKIYESLSEGGCVLISVPSSNALLYRLGLTRGFDERVGHLRRYEIKRLLTILENQGFKILLVRKSEGLFRNTLFISRFGSQVIRLANKFFIISDLFTFIDNITLKLFGESQLIVVAQKPKIKGK